MRRRRSIAIAALTAGFFAPPASAAEHAAFDYEREASLTTCPDATSMRDRVAARLGYDPFDADPQKASRTVVVRLKREGRALVGVVGMRARAQEGATAPSAERRITSDASDCRELADTLALTIALLVDPRAATFGAPAAPAPSAPPAPEPSPFDPPREEPPPPPPKEAAEGPRLHAALGLTGALGSVPGPTPGLSAGASLATPGWAIGVEARGDLPRETTDGARSVDAWLLVGSIVPCGRLGVLLVCGVLSGGALQGSSTTASMPSSQTTFYAAAGPRVAVWVPLSPSLLLAANVDGVFQLARTRLSVGGVEVWSSPAVAGIAGLGAVFRFR
jgi:hypothetical protein